MDRWKEAENDITKIKRKYKLDNTEVHTAWLLRKYKAQEKIPNFEKLPNDRRIYEVEKIEKLNC